MGIWRDFFHFQKTNENLLLARHCPITRDALRTVKKPILVAFDHIVETNESSFL